MNDKGLNEVNVTLVFDANELGEHWMNKDNLEMLLYSDANTRRDLLEVTAYSNERPEPKPDWISVEKFYDKLEASQVELTSEQAEILYSNLFDMYDS